jgi:predicted GIY-YIG superfamily endonuclease
MREHSEKKACRTTSSDPIDALVYSETFKTYPEALKREAEVKRWPRKKALFLYLHFILGRQ